MIRGEIYMMNFGVPFGSEPGYRRPVIVVQSNKDNLNKLNTTIVIPLTSNIVNAECTGNVFISMSESRLPKDSVALVHQIIVVDKFRLEVKISSVSNNIMNKIDSAIDYVIKE